MQSKKQLFLSLLEYFLVGVEFFFFEIASDQQRLGTTGLDDAGCYTMLEPIQNT